ncbi:MAG TPA: flagellar basal body P-ring protein FlgI [Candidatus Acidoferrales bacterium]|jgi:flagellar P-ring protein precursor FlgI|nr:flagellar basal body P-ring protein FlgI [Candidatus Acidoferrales bacterium]
MLRKCAVIFAAIIALAAAAAARPAARAAETDTPHGSTIKDLTTIEGVRDNPLVGYGVVVGLARTGDSQQTVFSTQTLSNLLRNMGVQVNPTSIMVNNVAAVFVTASLPPFARPGMKIDVTVSSAGDAKSLAGGMLLMTPLKAADGNVYAVAQGPLTLGGYSAGANGNAKVINHLNVGRIPEGGIVERDTAVDLANLTKLSLLLRDPDFAAARDVAAAINKELGRDAARPLDSRRIDIVGITAGVGAVPDLMARIGTLPISVHPAAKVVVNERTGTVVMGGAVTLGACSILHGNLAIEVTTKFEVSQPSAFSSVGQTEVVPQTEVQASEAPAQLIQLKEGATVEELVRGLQTLGAGARDIVSILQAIKAAGALEADLEVL